MISHIKLIKFGPFLSDLRGQFYQPKNLVKGDEVAAKRS